ncbi:LacI family DNA-binding transcriptional regulator [Bacillus sp. MUM 13]|uniref:LacI family DNA-binding transcriptional regulator n=1 Tax=Bacillus sp. MUM 13 TaxID=1678001 RepID=UPI0008F5CC08|nr:LacI family DNA-binding transcriptional regulator [Bacillus sp. MUM 13]OIK12182.1 LacI family transcriptional regulator [Bacillus sp. MUM 13]
MANIRQIAQLAGVSVTTVSRVLNNHPYVRNDKKEAVLRAIEESQYSRNINAVHLSRGKTNLIGVVTPYSNHPYYGGIIEGISKKAQEAGCHLVIFQTDYIKEKEQEALEMLKMKQLDGVIICSRSSDISLLKEYLAYGPIILCEDTSQTAFSSVSIDHYAAFSCALMHLAEKGHKKIGYSLGRKNSRNSSQRTKAYRDMIQKYNAEYQETWIFEGCYTMKDGEELFHKWSMLNNRPDALIITNDEAAAGCMIAARKSGIQIPEQLAIVGFDNNYISKMLDITTVSLPLEQIGITSFELLSSQTETRQVKLDYSLIERKSV